MKKKNGFAAFHSQVFFFCLFFFIMANWRAKSKAANTFYVIPRMCIFYLMHWLN